ncbi:MAG: glycosyltransferase [Lachnospiraceae bacterium]|nr:glycosyltransferase [Lachnospiraceae bacterium]
MQKTNICLINDSFPPAIDGVSNAVLNYAEIISGLSAKATVVTPYYPDADDSGYPFEVIRYPSVDTTRLVGYRAGIPFNPAIMNRLENSEFDLIHSHCPITSTMLARALRDRIDVPVVLTYHTKFDIDIANAIRSKTLQEGATRLLAENISACDEVWTVSNGAGENLRKIGYEGKYSVMPNGVDFPRGRLDEDRVAELTSGPDLPGGVPVFLFVGRMMWYKGIRIILDAMGMLKASGKDFRMVFIGSGADREEIMAYSAGLGLDGKVLFQEAVHDREQIRAWYCRADLFLFPSTFDTNGLVVREAAACALASILVKGSCAAEDVTDGISGFLIEENAQSLAARIMDLLTAPETMRVVGEGAQHDIYISWEESVKHAYERYGIILDDYRAGRYPKHNRMTDEFFHAVAKSLDAVIQTEKTAQKMRVIMTEERKKAMASATAGVNELGANIAGNVKKANDFAADLYHITDRFK